MKNLLLIITIFIMSFTSTELLSGGSDFSQKVITIVKIEDDEERFKKFHLLYKNISKENEYEEFSILPLISMDALKSDKLEAAKKYSIRLLKLAEKYQDDWNYGNAIHNGNLIKGYLELKQGDIIKAKEYLILSGKTPGSPQLNSFGPSMSLASALLDIGQTKVVIEYLHLCKKFWQDENGKIEKWIALINNGEKPYFGVNE